MWHSNEKITGNVLRIDNTVMGIKFQNQLEDAGGLCSIGKYWHLGNGENVSDHMENNH